MLQPMRPMSLKAAFDKIPEDHRRYAAVILQRAMSISGACPLVVGGLPTLDEVFNMLGRSITRKELLKDLQKRLNDSLGYFIIRKIEGVNDLIECCEREIKLLNQMIQGILQKEVPYVVRNDSEGVDVRVEVQP